MRRRPPITPPVLWPRVARWITINMPEIPEPICRDQPRHPVDRVHALGASSASHRSSPNPQIPRLPQPRMNPRAVLEPASRLSLRRPGRPPPTPLTTEPHVRLTSHERPAGTRALPLLRHKPEPHATRPPAPRNIHLGSTSPTPTLPAALRRVSTVTTLTDFQSGSIRPNPFSLLKPRIEKPRLRGSRDGCEPKSSGIGVAGANGALAVGDDPDLS
jgi:hypothetical protein